MVATVLQMVAIALEDTSLNLVIICRLMWVRWFIKIFFPVHYDLSIIDELELDVVIHCTESIVSHVWTIHKCKNNGEREIME